MVDFNLLNIFSFIHYKLIKMIFEIIMWGFLIDFSLILVFHLKFWRKYYLLHIYINTNIIIITLIFDILLILIESKNFSKVNLTILILKIFRNFNHIVMYFIGNKLNKLIDNENNYKKIILFKNIHKLFSIIIYITNKIFIWIYLRSLFTNYYLWIIISYLWFFITIHIILFIVFHNFIIRKDFVNKENFIKDQLNEQLINSIEKKNMKWFVENNPDLKWVLFEDKVINITKLRHPGGNFLFKFIYYTDITKLLKGNYHLSYKGNLFRHNHSKITLNYLDNFIINFIETDKIFYNRLGIISTLVQNIYNKKREIIIKYSNFNFLFNWDIEYLNELSIFKILFLKNEYLYMDLKNLNISDFIGKYIKFKVKGKYKENYYPIIYFLRKSYIRVKIDLIYEIKKIVKNFEYFLNIYEINWFKFLKDNFEDNINKTEFLPIFKNDNNKIKSLKNFSINGPFGFGIDFDKFNINKKLVVIVDDEGSFYFYDLLELIFLKISSFLIKDEDNKFNLETLKYFLVEGFDIEFKLIFKNNDWIDIFQKTINNIKLIIFFLKLKNYKINYIIYYDLRLKNNYKELFLLEEELDYYEYLISLNLNFMNKIYKNFKNNGLNKKLINHN